MQRDSETRRARGELILLLIFFFLFFFLGGGSGATPPEPPTALFLEAYLSIRVSIELAALVNEVIVILPLPSLREAPAISSYLVPQILLTVSSSSTDDEAPMATIID